MQMSNKVIHLQSLHKNTSETRHVTSDVVTNSRKNPLEEESKKDMTL